ncbi:hypothetical protein HOLleu_41039 [Holothuria leucospilota]|uniref:Uncharacterized protein n=1 Tax=Holothuria leucospilota TaxID=206669 RepID=A0A9Q0YDG7_HOLLE|nr:hypothetical protein HOLleu_41039 [Holothuria leucospilota]
MDKVAELQEDLDMLYKWSCDWQMLFNAQKCKCLHVGHFNAQASYFIGGVQVEAIEYEKDLGVLIDNSLSPSRQCHWLDHILNIVVRHGALICREI